MGLGGEGVCTVLIHDSWSKVEGGFKWVSRLCPPVTPHPPRSKDEGVMQFRICLNAAIKASIHRKFFFGNNFAYLYFLWGFGEKSVQFSSFGICTWALEN